MEIPATLGEWMKFRRKSLDLTQHQLAQQVGCSLAAIKKIEADERRPSRQIAQLLAGQLRLSTEQGDVFVRVARGELPLERLPMPKMEASPVTQQQLTRPFSTALPRPVAARVNIPHPATPIIGRERELAEITRLVNDPLCRLLTLTGIGGIGKTRLAIEAALQMQEVFPDGVYFIALSGVGSPSLITPAIASVLGMTFSGPVETKLQLFHYLHKRKALLILDNLEHLLEGAHLFSELLQNDPDIKLLATSREQLHLQAEWVFEVRGLPVPQTAQVDAIESSSASKLFIQRARQAQSGFHVEARDYIAIGQICQLVHGLPLAIELAARWTRALSCEDIAREIERSLEFLATNSRDVAPRDLSNRHRSLQAVFDHSWGLLTGEERFVLKQISVFRGGFRRDAVEQIAGANLSILSALIDKSLVWRNEANRYGVHELVRQYLAARLAENEAEKQTAHFKHSRYYMALLQQAEPAMRSREQKDALAALEMEIDNIRLAWNIAVEHGLFDLLGESAEPLYYYYELQQNFAEAEGIFQQASEAVRAQFAASGSPISTQEQPRLKMALANLINFQAFFNLRRGNNRDALALFETALSLLRSEEQDPSAWFRFPLSFGLIHAGVVFWALGDFQQAARRITEGLSLSSSLEQTWLRGLALGFLGGVWHDRGDYPEAYVCLQQAIELLQAGGDPYLVMFIGTYYSRTLLALHRLDEAQAFLKEGLPGIQETGNRWLTALGLEYLARVMRLSGDEQEAGGLLEQSVQMHREVGDPWSLTLALLELSRLKLQCADFIGAEQHALEALKMTAATGSMPIAMEGVGILAAICAEQGMVGEALCLVKHILQHPSSKQDTRDQAEKLRIEIDATLAPNQQDAVQKSHLPASFDALMKERFGFTLPPVP